MKLTLLKITVGWAPVIGFVGVSCAQEIEIDAKNLTFLATFDSSLTADSGKGIHHAWY